MLLRAQKLPQNIAPANQIIQLLLRQTPLPNQPLQPLQLLLRVTRILPRLLKHLRVVLRILILQRARQLLRLLRAIAIRARKLLHDAVERLDGAACGIETAAGRAVRAGVGVEEVDKVLLCAAAVVGERFGAALGEVLDCGVRGDALGCGEGLCIFGFGVDFGDEDGGLGGEVVGEGLPDGGEGLAVWGLLVRTGLGGWRNNVRPHHGAVNATMTSCSFPTFCGKLASSRKTTWLGSLPLTFGLMAVFSVMNLVKLSRSRPPL
jgi:hypothetical protein